MKSIKILFQEVEVLKINKDNSKIEIDQRKINNEILNKKSMELTDLSQTIKLAMQLLDHLSVDRNQGNEDILFSFIMAGTLGDLAQVLQNVQCKLQEIADELFSIQE